MPPVATDGNNINNLAKDEHLRASTSKVQANAAPLVLPGPPSTKGVDPLEQRQKLKETLAAAFRIFAKYGFDEGVAGHITVRDPIEPHNFWVNPFGLHFALITASDLILVDHSGKVIDGGPNRRLNTAAFMIHSAIHTARPDVNCAAHSHSMYGRTFSTFGRELDITTQDACVFWNQHVVYPSFNGVVLAAEEGQNIAKALGNKRAALLQNHGILTTGETIEECIFWFVSMEKCCQSQLLADAAAAGRGTPPVMIGAAEAEFTYSLIGTPKSGWFSGQSLFQLIDRETGGSHKV